MRSLALITLCSALVAAASAAAQTAIPEGPGAAALEPKFTGRVATPRPVRFAEPPRHPFMAPNGRSNLHVDAFQTDVHTFTGPLGDGMTRASNFFAHECASISFDTQGRIVTICVGLEAPILQLLDPATLEVLASMPLPPRQPQTTGGLNPFQTFSGGGYFYLDHRDRVVTPTTTRHVQVIAQTQAPGFEVVADHDLTAVVPDDDAILSALPDWSGRIWFVSTGGVVGTIDPAGGAVKARDTGEPIGNSFAVGDDGGVYVVTDVALYRFDADASGAPAVTWREVYANDGVRKPGQSQAGSGTTPTVMEDGLIAITDNADPVNVVVYRRDPGVQGSRLVCTHPLFQKGASSTDQSLIAAGRSIVAENNHGYTGPLATQNGGTAGGGIERVDVGGDGTCREVWSNPAKAPTSVPKLSAGSGLVYAWTKPHRDDGGDAWYLTAIDFRTGETVFEQLAGEGLGFNNNYAPITIGPDGTLYIGTLGGIVRLADRTPPPQGLSTGGAGTAAPPGRGARPRGLRLLVRGAGACAVRATVRGPRARHARQVVFRVWGARETDRRPPFTRRVRPRRLVVALVVLRGGRTVRLARRVPPCPRA